MRPAEMPYQIAYAAAYTSGMSDSTIGRWLREHWIDAIVAAGVLYLLSQISSLNREVGEISTTVGKLDESVSDLDEMPTKLAVLEEKVNVIGRDLEALRQKGAITSLFKQATFSRINPGESPAVYRWKFANPIDADSVASLSAEPLDLPAGIAASCSVDSDGTGCTMRLQGPPADLQSLPDEFTAKVTIAMRS